MRTLRIVSREEKPRSVDGHARTQEVEVTPPSESSGRRGEVPVRLESLPTPLRAVVRDHGEGCLRLEAELPWLAIGTRVHAGAPDGTERAGRVRAFDVEVTGEGSARLLIYATLGDEAPSPGAPPVRPRRRTRGRSGPSGLLVLALVLAAAASGYVARSFLGATRPAGAITLR